MEVRNLTENFGGMLVLAEISFHVAAGGFHVDLDVQAGRYVQHELGLLAVAEAHVAAIQPQLLALFLASLACQTAGEATTMRRPR